MAAAARTAAPSARCAAFWPDRRWLLDMVACAPPAMFGRDIADAVSGPPDPPSAATASWSDRGA
jgi:hypothetical protein